MSKAPGYALSHFPWNTRLERMVSSCKPLSCLKRANKKKIIKQLSTISSQLLNLRFDKIRLLFKEDREYRIKKCLSPTLVWHKRDSLSNNVL
jgi:hypothetical protein